jgi:Na+/H+ antiporter NhaC
MMNDDWRYQNDRRQNEDRREEKTGSPWIIFLIILIVIGFFALTGGAGFEVLALILRAIGLVFKFL